MQPNVYQPPSAESQQAALGHYDEDRDLAAVTPTGLSRIAGVVAIGTALYTLLMAFQATGLIRSRGMRNLIVPTMVVLGIALLAAGWKIRVLRGQATLAGMVASGVIGLVGAVWFITNLAFGVANLMPLIVVAAAFGSCGLCVATLKAAKQADAARKRLAEHGVNLGS